MSMILDALQRADRERQKQDKPLPSLDTPTAPPPAKTPSPKLAWWLAGAGATLSLLAALWFVALNRPPTFVPEPESEQSNRTAQAQEPAAAPEPRPEPAAPTPADKPPAIAELYQSPQVDDDSVTALYRTAESEGEASMEDAPKVVVIEGADGHTQELTERPEPKAVRLSEATPEPAEPALSESPQPEASSAEPAPAETASQDPESTPTPKISSIRDLPWNLQQTMPSLNYQRHDYREGAASRVVINGKEHRAGQQVAPDLTLERIEEDGAVMRYRGHEFKLRALNSWVNM